MSRREKTAFDLDFETKMRDPEFRRAYQRARTQIDAIDQLVRDLDAARQAQHMTKADVARRMGVPPEAVRRLFSMRSPNPTLKTIVAAAEAVGMTVKAVPEAGSAKGPSKGRTAAA